MARLRVYQPPPITFRASSPSSLSEAKGLSSPDYHLCKCRFHSLNDNPILSKELFLIYNITGNRGLCCTGILLHSFLTSLIPLCRFACDFL